MYVKYIYLYKYFFPVESALDVLRYTMRGGAKHNEIECAIQNVLVYYSTFRLSTSASLLLFLRLLLSQPFQNNKCTPIFKLRRKRLKRGGGLVLQIADHNDYWEGEVLVLEIDSLKYSN